MAEQGAPADWGTASGLRAHSPASRAATELAPAGRGSAGARSQTPGSLPVFPLVEALDLVPAETLLCWHGRPFPDTASADEASSVQELIQWAGPLALNKDVMLWARVLEALDLAIRHPHALALIDVRATLDETKNPPVARGDHIRFALIVQVDGHDLPIARVIQAAVNEQTGVDTSTTTVRQAAGWSYMELRDRRLPEWCPIAWGNIGQFLVFTVGLDVWADIAAVASGQKEALSHTQWLEETRDERARNALIEIVVHARDICARLDPFVHGRASAFFAAWQAEHIDRSYWALGFENRAMYCVASFVEAGQARPRLLADPNAEDPDLLATIPDGARYAVFRVSPAQILPRFFNGLLATRTVRERQNIQRLWKQIQETSGLDVDRDILSHFGEHIVMHNDPPHPLHIPLAMTTLTPIRDDPAQVGRAVNALSGAWRDAQQSLRETAGEDSNNMLINRDDDGIWHVDFGLFSGPAWVVTDRFLVTSWSPGALRLYLYKVGDRAGRPLEP